MMEAYESTDPLPIPSRKRDRGEGHNALKVGLTYNLKKEIESDVEDLEAEYDSIETVLAIKEALVESGCEVELIEACEGLFDKLKETKPDVVFNIAEGIGGRGREAQIPAILNFLGIPYTGSDETTLCIALDKALTKRVLSTYNICTPKYKLFHNSNINAVSSMKFPLIVKPNAEGSSKGISDIAVVNDISQLKETVRKNIEMYGQSMLAEEFISGREFTVAVVGNGSDMTVFPPMEIIYKNKQEKYNIYSFNVKKNYKEHIEYICPAKIDDKTSKKLINTAKKIYEKLECKDFSRIDFRLSEQGEVYFIEINPLPGLAPDYSDFPMIAKFNGIAYGTIVRMVLNSALKRYGLKPVLQE